MVSGDTYLANLSARKRSLTNRASTVTLKLQKA